MSLMGVVRARRTALGQKSCDVEHIGIVIQGRATAAMNDGQVVELGAGDIFYAALRTTTVESLGMNW